MAVVADPVGKSQAELIYELRKRREFMFNLNVNLSWLVLFGLLVFMFSGVQFSVGDVVIKTIQLDFDFMIPFNINQSGSSLARLT